jgi:hypothetical protein
LERVGRFRVLPIEVLTRDEIERLVEEKLKTLLAEAEIWKKITQLESSIVKLRDDVARLSIKKPAVSETEVLTAALVGDLAHRVDLLDIRTTLDSVTLKPKSYLGSQDFRAINEIVRKHGGSWSSERRVFLVRKRS